MADQRRSTDPLLTVRQLAEREGMTERRVRHLLTQGLPAYKACGVRIRLSEWHDWLGSRRR